jgi:amidophosphoribosyltransferase
MIAVRDRHGFRPLCLGKTRGPHAAYVVSSEPSSFSLIEAEFIRDIEPGEMLIFTKSGVTSTRPFPASGSKRCIFEWVYFARPDSILDGVSVYEARKAFGRALARENTIEADVVVPVPDSGVPATIGFAEASGIPYELGLVRSHYAGRTFIEPQQSIRHFGVRLKLSPVPEVFAGKRVIVVDDSIVRGTTSRKNVKMIRDAGAAEVHLRISSPPWRWPCYYGIDTPTRSELIASSHSIDEINQYITSDTLGYLSYDAMVNSVLETRARHDARQVAATERRSEIPGALPGAPPLGEIREAVPDTRRRGALPIYNSLNSESFCNACFTGNYPVEFRTPPRSRQMRLINA